MTENSVFVIGDSVSIHYGPYLKKFLEEKFTYDRKRGMKEALQDLDEPRGANAGDSRQVLEYLNEEYKKGIRYDILVINCGLHDLRVDRDTKDIEVPIDEYKSNLRDIISLCNKMASKIVWVEITPVIDEIHNSRKKGCLRYNSDVIAYNKAADELMKKSGIKIVPMYDFVRSLGEDVYLDHVHYKEEIRKLQAAFIAGFVEAV